MYEKLLSLLLEKRHSDLLRDCNYKLIPCSVIGMTEEGMAEFNEIYFTLRAVVKNKITRTPSGGVSIARRNFRPPMWDVRNTKSCIELTIILAEGCWRIQFRVYEKKEKWQTWGKTAFNEFIKVCDELGINMEDFAIDNGAEVKETIESPMIELFATPKRIYHNAHHLDLNSSHIAGMVKCYPEIAPAFEEIYARRQAEKQKKKEDPNYKSNDIYKDILTHTWGYLQSVSQCQAKWAHISRDGIRETNAKLRELSEKLVASGRTILAYNTDGIWYSGEVYHDENEGNRIGQWKNDYTNCIRWRAKSKGAYEFITEEGNYKPVIRGLTQLDKIKERKDWVWGDIFADGSEIVVFYWNEDDGVFIK